MKHSTQLRKVINQLEDVDAFDEMVATLLFAIKIEETRYAIDIDDGVSYNTLNILGKSIYKLTIGR